jgi:hypothetical protein
MVFTRPVLFRVARIVGVAVLTRLTDVFPIPLSTAHVIAALDRAASARQVVNHPITAGQDLASAWLTYRGRSRRTVATERNFPGRSPSFGRGLTRFARLAFYFWPIWSIDIGCREDVP